MHKSIIKKLVSCTVAFSFAISALLYPFNYIVSAASIPTTYGTNLLSGLTMTAQYSLDGGTTITPLANNGKFSNINDGNLGSEFFVGNPVYFAEEVGGQKVYYNDGTKVFLDIQFDMGETKKAKAFYMLNSSNDLLRTTSYQVYLSNNPETVFDPANLKKDFENTNNDEENTIVFDNAIAARYLGIRILDPVSYPISNVSNVFTRIMEVALLGEEASMEEKYGSDLLNGLKMSAEYSVDGGATITPLSDNTKFSNINDDKEDTEFFLGTPKFAENIGGSNVYYKDGSKVFLNISFNLGATKKVKAFYMCNCTNNDMLITNRYKIYLSNKKADLFDDSKSLIKDFTNTNNDVRNLIVLDDAVEAQYFGIKILNPVSREISNPDNIYTRINEISLFGEAAPPPTISGENLLENVSMSAYYSTDGTTRKPLPDNGLFKNVNDGDLSTEFFTSTPKFAESIGGSNVYYKDGSKVFLDLVFDLEDTQKINALTIVNNSNPLLRTKRFKVYLSNKMSDLFNETDSLIEDISNDNGEEQFSYILSEPRNARYFGIRILDPVQYNISNAADVYTRIQELMLFGERKESNVSVVATDFTAGKEQITKLKDKTNLLYDTKYYEIQQFTDGVDTSSTAEGNMIGNPKALTNAVANDAAFFPGAIYFNSDGTPKNKAPYEDVVTYTSISYYLGGEAEVDEVWIYNHSNKSLVTYAYEVYISDSNLTLYEADNLVKRYINTTSSTKQEFKFKKAYKGKYIGIKYLVPVPPSGSVSDSNRYIRASQIAAFGTVKAEEDGLSYDELYAEYDYNVVKNISPTAFGYDGNKYSQIDCNLKNLTDEEFENEIKISSIKFAETDGSGVNYFENGERYVDFIFNFKTTVDIDAVSLTNHPATNRMNYKYELYASNDKDKLFDTDSRIKSFENTAKEQVNLFKFDGTKDYSFFGIRIIDPLCGEVMVNDSVNEAIARMCDLAVFGSYTDPNYKINNVTNIIALSNAEFNAFGDSIIAGMKTPKWFYNNASIPAPYAYVEQSPYLTDGKINTHKDYNGSKYKLSTTDGSNTLDVQYTFGAMYDLSGFTFIGTSETSSEQYYTGWYQVYVSEDPDMLFVPENMVFEYNWEESGAYRGHNVNFENYKARGMAFGIRLLSPVTYATVWPIPRLTEIAVYGELANIEILPTNLAANMPVSAYSEDANGKLHEISDSNFTVSESRKLVDDNPDTKATIKTSHKKLHLLYNLCNDVLLTDLKLDSTAGKYKVYASDDINEVWEESSLIYSYTGKGTNGKTLSGKAATTKYRYVRFEITDFTSPLTIYEASVIGGDNQLLKYKQISRTFSYGNVNLTTYSYESKVMDYITSDAYFYKLFDNDIYTSICVEGGKHNEETIDMTITFDDVKNIDSISLYFPDMLDGYNPTKLELYTSENLSELSNGVPEDAEPLKVFNGLPEDGVYKADFKPQFARVMVIRFICGNQEYDGYDGYMCFAINEIKIMGTSVVGIQPDELAEELISFTDEESGITASVLKYDKNDIFTGVTGMRVEKLPATLAQKIALAETGALKISDESVYKVDFLDVVGNVVTDLGGRAYRIQMNYDKEKINMAMIASGEGKDCKVVDSLDSGGVVYYDKYDFEENQYMLVVFTNSDDPYFDGLDVEIPETDNPYEGDTSYEDISDGEIIDDAIGTNPDDLFLEDDILSDSTAEGDDIAPATGENVPIHIAVIFVLFAVSSLTVVLAARRNAIK